MSLKRKSDDNFEFELESIIKKSRPTKEDEEFEDLLKFVDDLGYIQDKNTSKNDHILNILDRYPDNIRQAYFNYFNSNNTLTCHENNLYQKEDLKPWFDYIIPKIKLDLQKYYKYLEFNIQLYFKLISIEEIINVQNKLCKLYLDIINDPNYNKVISYNTNFRYDFKNKYDVFKKNIYIETKNRNYILDKYNKNKENLNLFLKNKPYLYNL